ncbi:hypothetical protein SAMN06265222_12071 [Neorhodopirellula lusitana]|uniref:Uncharacterized protein n=1 Tax=Neorhodopirellula lusitana TaxID=445327 RepID=A0ABY1QQT6_9BACT|nr:hypothetical protein SAMN06265222_12071 [Neorhodopirellula lusitana]
MMDPATASCGSRQPANKMETDMVAFFSAKPLESRLQPIPYTFPQTNPDILRSMKLELAW